MALFDVSWFNSLRPASFRGRVFKVSTHNRDVGRKLVVHEFPGRDVPFVEDLGRKGRVYTIEGFVLSDTFFAAKRIQEACEKEGPGILIHPTLGRKTVSCDNCNITGVMKEGRMTRFSFTFFESGQNAFPEQSSDFDSLIPSSITSALSEFTDVFESEYNPIGPNFILNGAIADVTNAYEMADSIVQKLPTVINTESVSEFLDTTGAAVTDLQTDASTAQAMASNITDTLSGLSEIL
jgi:prophage DNA circulation protein